MMQKYLKLRLCENPTVESVLYFIKCSKEEINSNISRRLCMFSNAFDETLSRVGDDTIYQDNEDISFEEDMDFLETSAFEISHYLSKVDYNIYFIDNDVIEARELAALLKKEYTEDDLFFYDGIDPLDDIEDYFLDDGIDPLDDIEDYYKRL